MKNNLLLTIIVALLTISTFESTSNLFAQNETGTRYLNKERFQSQKNWYDSSTAVFQERFPIIRSIPPLSTDMPYDVLVSYVYLDSLLRFASDKAIDSLLDTWNSLNDTLTGALKYMYIINDYNPIIFNQYANEVRFYKKRGKKLIQMIGVPSDTVGYYSQGPYQADLFRFKWDLCEKEMSIVTDSNKMAYYSMLYADYILRIKIVSIDSMLNKRGSHDYYKYQVTAIVLDTLKGKNIPLHCPGLTVNIRNSSEFECIFNFQFSWQLYGMFGVEGKTPLYNKPDTAFLDERKNGFKMKIGQEAIVFIHLQNPIFDFQNDYFDLFLSGRCSLNALRIENDIVFDINKVWSNQEIIPYSAWKQIYQNLLNNIMNGTY